MNVKELKEILAKCPEDMPVMVSGYEGGYNDVSSAHEIKVELNYNSQDYYGNHEETDKATVKALLIFGSREEKVNL